MRMKTGFQVVFLKHVVVHLSVVLDAHEFFMGLLL